jgi:hypothetical protein
MLAKYPMAPAAAPSEKAAASFARPVTAPVPLPTSDVAELIHLARAVLLKSPEDLVAIATAAPSMPINWMEAFAAERTRAEAEAHFWSTAIAYLMATSPGSAANDG